ncbi:MAG: SDR family oxidoreductase [Acidimicrobiales bacterium]|nr:SDR family oxidoreductase [Acidimicrobiales bacterium]
MTSPSTAADRRDGRKYAIVTGGNSGIGLATAQGLAAQDCCVDITVRSAEKGRAAVQAINAATGNSRVGYRILDLASLASVRDFTAQVVSDTEKLDLLIANAGVVTSKRTETADGFEMMFGVNHLGHFVLVNGLLDVVKAAAPSRIVIVASGAHKFAKDGIPFDDLQSERSFSSMKVYGQSKLANMLFTRELAKRLDGTGVTVNSVHPGAVRTRLARDGDAGLLGDLAMRVVSPFFRSPEKGAATTLHVATEPSLATTTGQYFANSKPETTAPTAQDDAAAERLWSISEELTAP